MLTEIKEIEELLEIEVLEIPNLVTKTISIIETGEVLRIIEEGIIEEAIIGEEIIEEGTSEKASEITEKIGEIKKIN